VRVQALSASRNIKVYWNGVLKIDYTETDTSRSNSGLVGSAHSLAPPSWITSYLKNESNGRERRSR